MAKYYICISRYIINSVLHFVCRSFCFRINTPFVLEITAIQKICASENYNGYDHHCYSVHNINSLSFVFFTFILYIKKAPAILSDNKGGMFRGTTLYYHIYH